LPYKKGFTRQLAKTESLASAPYRRISLEEKSVGGAFQMINRIDVRRKGGKKLRGGGWKEVSEIEDASRLESYGAKKP